MTSIAHNPIVIAAVVRTNWRRLIAKRRRQRSVSDSASAMMVSCSAVEGGGMNSPLEHGSTSTGSASLGSAHDRFHRGITS
jgi:hypothetical protein